MFLILNQPYLVYYTYVSMPESEISIKLIKNILTEMFREQYERQEPLFKPHKETILSIIISNTKISTQ